MDFIKSFFKLEERGSKISTELIAGLTTFLAMAYILPVNSFMLVKTGMPLGGVFFATAVAAAVATLIMGIFANLPVALAPGMGLNAFFTFTLVFGAGLSWQSALAAVLVSGALFFIISVTGLRKIIINSIPVGLKYAVGAGIGFFITFIGLKNAGIIVANGATLVALGDLSHPTVLLGLFGILLVVVLYAMGNKFSLILAIVITAIVGVVLGLLGVDMMPAYSNFAMDGVWSGAGETIFAAFSGFGDLFNHPEVFSIIFALLFVDFFDTAGTLMAVGNQAGLINDKGEIVGSDRALIADSIGTMTGALLGTSNVTSYIESSTGIEQGGRTGLSSVVVAILFLLAVLAYPLLSVVNGVTVGLDGFGDPIVYSPVTAMALVLVGSLMVGQLKEIDWDDKAIVIPAFLTIVFMLLTFSIATGIAVGFIFYPIVKVAQRKYKEVNIVMYILAALFIINFIVTYS
ncbi:MAG: NCS2 family permease [Bacilli bacterium]|nr:NCS2 family permease [Bacilli bacterium]